MKITVLRKMRYVQSFIYILQFQYEFQYLVPHGNDIYQDRLTVIPGLFKRVLWRLGFIKSPYTRKQIEEYETIVLSGAMSKIDQVNDPKYKKERRKKIKELKLSRAKERQKDCVWQARHFKKEIYYYCLIHKEVVKMKEGVAPKHN